MSKILLVEDNPNAVKRIIRYINRIFAELDVVSFHEAGEALQYAKANDVSLFILDIQLEDYKGNSLGSIWMVLACWFICLDNPNASRNAVTNSSSLNGFTRKL